MLKESEIRCGNYFTHNENWNSFGHKGLFKWTSYEWYLLGECRIDLEDVSPVLLSEDILLKSGFLKKNNGIETHLCFGRFYWCSSCPTNIYIEYYSGEIEVECKYLHQLQNLYFDVTNEELEINI